MSEVEAVGGFVGSSFSACCSMPASCWRLRLHALHAAVDGTGCVSDILSAPLHSFLQKAINLRTKRRIKLRALVFILSMT